MKAILKEDVKLIGFGVLRAGTSYEVRKYNTRNVYLICGNGSTAVVSRKVCTINEKTDRRCKR